MLFLLQKMIKWKYRLCKFTFCNCIGDFLISKFIEKFPDCHSYQLFLEPIKELFLVHPIPGRLGRLGSLKTTLNYGLQNPSAKLAQSA